MASIKEEGTRGKRLSYKIHVCLGRDENGRQISKAMHWNSPEDMTPAKARKEAQQVAAVWEAEQKEAFERQKAQQEGRKTDYTFGQFVDEVWIPLCVRDGSHRPSTVAMYTNILKVMRLHFEELLLSGISGIQITQYLTWLRNDYRTQYGKPLAEKSIKHHYNILSFIFGYHTTPRGKKEGRYNGKLVLNFLCGCDILFLRRNQIVFNTKAVFLLR